MKKIVLLLFLAVSMVASAQMIGATNSQGTFRPAGDSPLIRPTGPSLRFGIGTPYASLAFDYQLSPWLMVGAGAGFGDAFITKYTDYYETPVNSWEWIYTGTANQDQYDFNHGIPLFFEAEVRTPRYKWSVFLNVRLGYNLQLHEDYTRDYRHDVIYEYRDYAYVEHFMANRFFLATYAGISYRYFNLGIGYSNSITIFDNDGFAVNISYDLPITTLRRWLTY